MRAGQNSDQAQWTRAVRDRGALGRLEMARLIVKDFGGHSLTIRGARFAKVLAQHTR
jgi:hypothetical protein